MEIKDLINKENNVAIQTVLIIAKQDIAINNCIESLNELCHTNKINFTHYNSEFGLTPELMQEVRDLKEKLAKAKYGRFI